MKTNKFYRILCCLLCGVLFNPLCASADEHIHNMVEELKEPTCTEEGYYNYYCDICGYSPDGVQVLPKTDHRVENWITDYPPTCVNFGQEHGNCADCGTLVYRSVEPNGIHRARTIYSFPSTTRSDGEFLMRCDFCNQTLEKRVILRIKMLALEKGKYVFDNLQHKPKVIAYDRKDNIINEKNYTVRYDKDAVSIGTHRARIEFLGDYECEEVLTYRIVPKGVAIKKIKARKKGADITVPKLPKEASGWQLSYSRDKKFSKPKTVTVSGKKQLTKRVKSLKSKKKYYFRVRTYTTVKDTKYYSDWSAPKSVKIR